jgi:hypothetical protein
MKTFFLGRYFSGYSIQYNMQHVELLKSKFNEIGKKSKIVIFIHLTSISMEKNHRY